MSRRRPRRGERADRQARMRLIAEVLQQGEPSRFRFEGACRHAVRARLCLDGWPYHAADAEAHELVQGALDMIAARRPSWAMGQPECVQQGVRAHEPVHCKRCGRTLPEGHKLWCSKVCFNAARIERMTHEERQRKRAVTEASHAAWRARQPHRHCEQCGKAFKPRKPSEKNQRFCCLQCANRNFSEKAWKSRKAHASK